MEKRKLEINEENVRLDKFIMNSISDLSRTLIQEYIKEGHVLVNGKIEKASYKIKMNDAIEITIPDNKEMDVLPEDIPLDIVYEDQDVIVVNKPSGMIVHPSAGIYSGTLVNALLYHCKDLSGNKVTEKPEILFARLDIKEVMEKVEAMKKKEAEKVGTAEEKKEEAVIEIEAKPEITFDDFMKMQFQVGEIIACEEVKKSKKLLCSQVKIGNQVKQIVSGIKSNYKPEDMVGKKVMVLVNLKPAKLAGVLSEGMLLCAEDENGKLALMTPDKEMPAGAEIC